MRDSEWLTKNEFIVMRAIYNGSGKHGDNLSMTELAEKTNKNLTNIVQVLNDLEEIGLVRKRDGEDRRISLVELTDYGYDVLVPAENLYENLRSRE